MSDPKNDLYIVAKEKAFFDSFKAYDSLVSMMVKECKAWVNSKVRENNLFYLTLPIGRPKNGVNDLNFEKNISVEFGFWARVVRIGSIDLILEDEDIVKANYIEDAIYNEVTRRMEDYYEKSVKRLYIHHLIDQGKAIRYENNIFVLDYNPKGEGLSVAHWCQAGENGARSYTNGWAHRFALRLRCDHCGAHLNKKKKCSALLTLNMNDL